MWNAGSMSMFEHNLPDCGCAQRLPRQNSIFSHRPKYPSLSDLSRSGPGIESLFDPRRDRDQANPLPFSDQMRNDPPILTHLNVFDILRHQFLPAKAASDKDREDGAIPLAF